MRTDRRDLPVCRGTLIISLDRHLQFILSGVVLTLIRVCACLTDAGPYNQKDIQKFAFHIHAPGYKTPLVVGCNSLLQLEEWVEAIREGIARAGVLVRRLYNADVTWLGLSPFTGEMTLVPTTFLLSTAGIQTLSVVL